MLNNENFIPSNTTRADSLIPVHINKSRDDTHFWDWSSDLKGWIRGNEIPEKLQRMYKNPKP